MSALGAVELFGFGLLRIRCCLPGRIAGAMGWYYILLALLNGSVAVRVGDLGDLAKGGGDSAVGESQDGHDAEGNRDDGTGEVSD